MTPDQVRLVRESWEKVKPIAPTAAGLFYGRLFEIEPSVRPLFKREIGEQGRMLMQMISVVVARLDNLGELVPAVRKLGARHAAYGVRDEHYAPVGAALLWTLEQGLGDAFTPATRDAWATAYGILAETMMDAARLAELPQAA
jgi:hemoglobin-like flavoprotein